MSDANPWQKIIFVLSRRILVPACYLPEYKEQTVQILKFRVQLFLGMIVALYVSSYVFNSVWNYPWPSFWEIATDLLTMAVALALIVFAGKSRSHVTIKISAYLMTLLLLAGFCSMYFLYPVCFDLGMGPFLLLFLLITMAMPWHPLEILVLGCLLVLSFALALSLTHSRHSHDLVYFQLNCFGMVFAILATMVYKHFDEEKRKEQFLLRKELGEKNNLIKKELEMARQIHKSIIPKSFSNEQVDIAVSFLPASYVGGDYAKFYFPTPDKLLLFIMDITGHGVPAALMVNRIHSEVNQLAEQSLLPGVFLEKLDRFVQETFQETSFLLSAYACLLDFKKKILFYSNFGHPPQVLFQSKKREIFYMNPQRHLLGIVETRAPEIHELKVDFDREDRILLFTDGLLEARNGKDLFFGKDGVEDYLKRYPDLKPEAFNRGLVEALQRFRGRDDFADDIFLLTIEIK
ncbi:MAG: PP2C family protein-serine/threonine phosphatase [Candidatus Omnitrophota bacterium]